MKVSEISCVRIPVRIRNNKKTTFLEVPQEKCLEKNLRDIFEEFLIKILGKFVKEFAGNPGGTIAEICRTIPAEFPKGTVVRISGGIPPRVPEWRDFRRNSWKNDGNNSS